MILLDIHTKQHKKTKLKICNWWNYNFLNMKNEYKWKAKELLLYFVFSPSLFLWRTRVEYNSVLNNVGLQFYNSTWSVLAVEITKIKEQLTVISQQLIAAKFIHHVNKYVLWYVEILARDIIWIDGFRLL